MADNCDMTTPRTSTLTSGSGLRITRQWASVGGEVLLMVPQPLQVTTLPRTARCTHASSVESHCEQPNLSRSISVHMAGKIYVYDAGSSPPLHGTVQVACHALSVEFRLKMRSICASAACHLILDFIADPCYLPQDFIDLGLVEYVWWENESNRT